MTTTQSMNRRWARPLLLAGVLLSGLMLALPACQGDRNPGPGNPGDGDAGVDAGTDGGTDAGSDAGTDAGEDAGTDVGTLPDCATDEALALGQCVDADRYQTDLTTIAVPRPKASRNLEAIRDLCADRLTELGFEVERHAYGTGVNVIGVRAGTDAEGPRVLLGAHYDSTDACAGADDNATGVAGALEAARVLSTATFPGTLVVACWDEEELGLIGSRAYADRARTRNEVIDAHFNLEMIGYTDDAPNSQTLPEGLELLFPDQVREIEENENRGDFIAVIGDPASAGVVDRLEHFADLLELPFIGLVIPAPLLDSPAVADLRRSDHASFWANDFPGMMLTDTSEFRYPGYHCGDGSDEVGRLDQAFSAQVLRMTVSAAAEALGL